MRRRRHGLTLLELVATLGTVALLGGLVLAAVSTARRTARATQCLANLRQLHLATATYVATHDAYPAAVLYFVEDGGIRTRSWDFDHRSDGRIEPGPIWYYLDGPESVFQCPDFEGSSTFGDDPATGYNYNTTYVGAEGLPPIPGPDGRPLDGWNRCRRGIPAAAHRRGWRTALFGDGGWIDGANKFMRAPSNDVETDLNLVHGGTQAFRHSGCTHVCCLDGHVESRQVPFRGVHADEARLANISNFPDNGFLSDDDTAYDPR